MQCTNSAFACAGDAMWRRCPTPPRPRLVTMDRPGRPAPRAQTSRRISFPGYAPMTRIYLIEDNPLIATTLTDGLREFSGCEVVATASSSDEAIDWLDANPDAWDAAVID